MKYSEYFEALSEKAVTDTELEELEKKLGFVFPEDYKAFLKERNGVKVRSECICSFPIRFCSEKREVLQGIFSMDRSVKDGCVQEYAEFYKDDICRGNRCRLVPIGISAFGSVIFIKESGKVILADFSLGFKSSLPFKCTYKIANSFTKFLELLEFEG